MKISQRIKEFLKRFLPPPVKAFNREVARILGVLVDQRKCADAHLDRIELEILRCETALDSFRAILTEIDRKVVCQGDTLEAIYKKQEEVNRNAAVLRETLQGQAEAFDRELLGLQTQEEAIQHDLTSLKEQTVHLAKQIERTRGQGITAARIAEESTWAAIYNNTVVDSIWLKNRTFSPGRWAIGYPFLYVMYRVLNESHPKRILELGLGQSTRMLAQYAEAFEDVEHIVVEHDQDWIDFFKNDFRLSEHSEIVKLDLGMVPYREAAAVRGFKGFRERFANQRFDFIVIDAPLGSDMKEYSRIDILGILPDCLEEKFCVMMDDYMRTGEQNTAARIQEILQENQIGYASGKYSGRKDIFVLASEDQKFLCTL